LIYSFLSFATREVISTKDFNEIKCKDNRLFQIVKSRTKNKMKEKETYAEFLFYYEGKSKDLKQLVLTVNKKGCQLIVSDNNKNLVTTTREDCNSILSSLDTNGLPTGDYQYKKVDTAKIDGTYLLKKSDNNLTFAELFKRTDHIFGGIPDLINECKRDNGVDYQRRLNDSTVVDPKDGNSNESGDPQ